jgi:CRP-like cAMP-binding protein
MHSLSFMRRGYYHFNLPPATFWIDVMYHKAELIQHFYPLNQVASKYHSQLESKLIIKQFKPGELIIRKTHDKNISHFLILGAIEIRQSFEERQQFASDDQQSKKSIESHIKNRATVKASNECAVLIVCNDDVDQLLSWGQDYSIFYLDEGGSSILDTDLIDDDFQEDWDNTFLQSQLAANLSNSSMHQLLSYIEDVDVSEGEVVVKRYSPADYFYIVKKGFAEVSTDLRGPFKGESFTLGAGDYFGDEALIADTTRNANVTMKTDGTLGRVSKELFVKLIKEFLVSPITDQIVSQHNDVKVIDIRFPMEYRKEHYKNSENIPISFLRKQLSTLQQSMLYIVTPENDCRSELATYLMRQAGFEAYHLPHKTDDEPVLLSL